MRLRILMLAARLFILIECNLLHSMRYADSVQLFTTICEEGLPLRSSLATNSLPHDGLEIPRAFRNAEPETGRRRQVMAVALILEILKSEIIAYSYDTCTNAANHSVRLIDGQ